jgi:hypothetical protein
MLKFIQNTRISSIVFGSAALIALISVTAPAAAQGVPAGLLRLDSSQGFNDDARLTEAQQTKIRGAYAYAHVRKHRIAR